MFLCLASLFSCAGQYGSPLFLLSEGWLLGNENHLYTLGYCLLNVPKWLSLSTSDNYGFVTYRYAEEAFAAIESGHKLRQADEQPFDLCFGGRRQFCKRSYSDLGEWREDLRFWHTYYIFSPEGFLAFRVDLRQTFHQIYK